MKKLKTALLRANAVLLFGAALLLALILELFIFNFSYFSQSFGDYERLELDLSACEGYNGEGLPLAPEAPTAAFGGFSLPVRSVTVRTAGPNQVFSGNIGICDEASAYRTTGAASFQVNPGGAESTFTAALHSRGNLTRLRITFDEESTEPIFLSSVVFNEHISLQIHWLRLALMTGLFFLLFCILRYRLYDQEYCLEKRSHRLMNLTVLFLCLLVSLGILYTADPSHTYLTDYPDLQELRSDESLTDAYVQQLDAFGKGQLNLDLDVNPELEALDNPYDKGERDKKGVTYHWDRAFYNGKYYSYFGLAPLFTVYYPVCLLTGRLPTVLLANSLLAAFAILCIFAAIKALYRTLRPRANLLLFLTGEAAVVTGSFLYLIQASLSFYYIPLLSAVGWLAAFVALAFSACRAEKTPKRILLFALCGLSVVMLVLSRPNMVLLAAAFAAPLFLQLLFDREAALRKKLASAVPFLIPVILGGAAIMYYNYVRFGSIFEFGTSYQLTESDIRYNTFTLSLHHFLSMLYHYFLEPFSYTEFFPFLRFTTEKCLDFGNYLYQEYSAGLFQMPLNLGVLLCSLTFCRRKTAGTAVPSGSRRLSLQKWTYGLLILAMLALGYLDFLLGGIHIRYVCDLSLTLSLLSFLLILEHVHFGQSRSARILYLAVLCLCLITIGRGLLTIFSNERNDILYQNPDFYLWVGKMFRTS